MAKTTRREVLATGATLVAASLVSRAADAETAAKAAGMPSAAAAWGYIGHNGEIATWGADVIVAQPLDLLPHLGG